MLSVVKQMIKRNEIVEMIYIDANDHLTKRRVKIFKLDKQTIVAYCFARRSIRTFKIDHILAITPIIENHLIAH